MKHILIIEDDTAIAELERDYLEANGFTTTICADGEEGLHMALSQEFDLILLDIMLPHGDGFDICRRIRKVKHIPILLVSARREDIDKIKGLGLGANDYIVKPFRPGELVARVKAHIATYERLTQVNPTPNILSIGSLCIHTDAHEVFLHEKLLTFPHKEYELLVFLAQHPNIVFSKEQLFERIWGLDAIGEISTVTVHINRIRDKLEADGTHFIETVWGSGYRFRG